MVHDTHVGVHGDQTLSQAGSSSGNRSRRGVVVFGNGGGQVHVFVRGVYWFEDFLDSLPINDYARHIAGMLIVGVMIYLLQRNAGHYYIQGVGYAKIMDVISGVLLNEALPIMCAAGASCIVVTKSGEAGLAADVVGVVAEREIAAFHDKTTNLLCRRAGPESACMAM